MIRTTLTAVIAAAALAASAGGVWFAEAGTALAPEPAVLTAYSYLSGSNGATAAATYADTAVETGVVKWPQTYYYNPNLAAGTPCSPSDLGPWATTSRVIQTTGNYAKCV